MTDSPTPQDAYYFIAGLDEVDLARFRVVGGYIRYDEGVRNALQDAIVVVLSQFGETARETGRRCCNAFQADETASYKKFSTTAELEELVANDLALLLTERFAAAPGGGISISRARHSCVKLRLQKPFR